MRERGRRTDEILDAVKLLLTEENVSFNGEFYQFEDVTIEPRPVPAHAARLGFASQLASDLQYKKTYPSLCCDGATEHIVPTLG